MERIKCQCKHGCKKDITFNTGYYLPKNDICWCCWWGIVDGYGDVHGIKMDKYTDEQLEEEWDKVVNETYSRNLDKLYCDSLITDKRGLDFPQYMTGKTILYSFNIYSKEVIIGFTDGTWIVLAVNNDMENGVSSIGPYWGLDELPNCIVDFRWYIVTEFEKAGILKDTQVLREILRRKAIENIDKEINKYSGRFDYLRKEKERLESGILFETGE